MPTVPKWKVRWFFIRFSLFKRSGLRVHLSEEELMVVRPSLMESRLGLVFSGAMPVQALHPRCCSPERNGFAM